jgi:protein required for attachment to host cells
MLLDGTAWFLVADGRRARLYLEPRRGAELRDLWSEEIGRADLYDPQDRPPRSFDRVGAGRHAMDKGRSLHEQEEANFLKRIAERIAQAEKQREFDHLVITAPPRALGILRDLLPDGVKARIRAEAAKDLVDETPAQLRERLTELLRG